MELKENYIVGFVDGEGTFNLIKYPKNRIRPQFLVFNTNKKILEDIKETLKINAPIYEVFRINDLIKRRKKCYRLQARSREDISKIIDFFDKNQPIIKIRDYLIFKKVYENWINSYSNI